MIELSSQFSKNLPLLTFIALLGLLIRLSFALTSYGTNDVFSWEFFMKYLVKHDSFSIYQDLTSKSLINYNHPPLISYLLLLINKILNLGIGNFSLLIRSPAILADFGSTIIAFMIALKLCNIRQAIFVGTAIALNPVLIFISGFHGNMDSLFLFFILLAILLNIYNKSPLIIGLCFGLALNIKIVPILFFPAFIFYFKNRLTCYQFLLGLSTLLILGYGYHFYHTPHQLIQNIFLYTATSGSWGITKFFPDFQGLAFLKILILFLTIAVAFYQLQFQSITDHHQKKIIFLRIIPITLLIFYTFTPGFGLQYLSWFALLGVFIGWKTFLTFTLLSSIYLFNLYTFASEGYPWDFANFFLIQELPFWLGVQANILWSFLALILIYHIWILIFKNQKLID